MPALKKFGGSWRGPALAAFIFVLGAQLWLVAVAGTDVPFQDQWDVEGSWLYPSYLSGTLTWSDLLHPYNENRIVWTHLLNLGLFILDGQWDPLVQLVANAILHGILAACLVGVFGRVFRGALLWSGAFLIAALSLPGVSWANALWGFQSQVYIVLIFSITGLVLLTAPPTNFRQRGGWVAIAGALLAMGPGLAVPLVLAAMLLVRGIAAKKISRSEQLGGVIALALFCLFYFSRAPNPALEPLRPKTAGDFFLALRTMLAFPFAEQGGPAALLGQLPIFLFLLKKIRRRNDYTPSADGLLACGILFWVIAVAAAASRGGASDFGAHVPWRYVDFCTLGVMANLGAVLYLIQTELGERKTLFRWVGTAWVFVLFLGWTAITLEVWRGVIRPRMADREAPVRLMQEFQRRGNTLTFAGQPRLLIPHPSLSVVSRVLADPRMRDHLPPSLQEDRKLGPLSKAVRGILRQTSGYSKPTNPASGGT